VCRTALILDALGPHSSRLEQLRTAWDGEIAKNSVPGRRVIVAPAVVGFASTPIALCRIDLPENRMEKAGQEFERPPVNFRTTLNPGERRNPYQGLPVRLVLQNLRVVELDEAVRVVTHSMRDNPANVRALGIEDADQRSRSLTRLIRPLLRGLYKRGVIRGAFSDSRLVGVCGMAEPGSCQPTLLEKIEIMSSLVVGNTKGTVIRVARWASEWARRDPPSPHWHLGPVAVEPPFQGKGIGGAMLSAYCVCMDQKQTLAYLETDKRENVGFYQRFGFRVIEEGQVLGVPTWFMSRAPKPQEALPASSCATSIQVCSKNLKD